MSAAVDKPAEKSKKGAKAVLPPVNKPVFIAAALGTLAITIWALIAPTNAEGVLGAVVGWTSDWFGWFYVLLVAAVLIFVIYLAASKYGNTKLGPEHSKPEFGLLAWASMLFAAGISTDLMFFAVSEPVTQYLAPPSTQPETVDAAREATVWTLFHYGLSGWGLYALMGIALAYFAYRMNMPLAIRSALAPIFGKRVHGALGDTVDIAALLGTVFGVATSLGIGVVMVNTGLNQVFGIPIGVGSQISIVVVGIIVATLSAVSGVDKGIKFLSILNVFLAVALSLWVLIAGNTQFLLNAFVLNVFDFIRMFPDMAGQTFAFEDTGTWMTDWTLFFWAWWIAFASFVGLFLARISRGRTIRQFVLGTLTIPFIYIFMWISIYGNSALDLIRNGDKEFGEKTMLNPEGGFYELLSNYPGFVIIAALATITALLFYVTTADSAALVMANLSSRLPTPQDDGRPGLRIFWAIATGGLTIAMLIVGGVGALQNATVVMGLPFAFVVILVMIGLYKALRVEANRVDSVDQSLPGSLARRSRTGDGHEPWQRQLSRVLSFPSGNKARDFEREVLTPTLEEVAAELTERGVAARCGRIDTEGQFVDDGELIQLEVDGEGQYPFRYQIWPHKVSVPSFGGHVPRGTEDYYRMEVYLDGGAGQGYDIMGYSKEQLIDDVLDKYGRHVEFLQLQENIANHDD
ncbi:MAG: choline BCCT transporter BetT [Brevibacterium sp.]|uniref:choline BCCT transporter BetT n=1 Tax=Brevibacterium sandarakinum TaxID=629680 RepID=UPI0026514717|nr:choline BCCT transporter BetT [Brevibacterium sandarakinum]MDN5585458.1 choline BCCT transporter BetT [Brevibacterium sp.]MDN5634764.1 choline BCCT transporter BetT [Brevibacterium sp.]MDN5657668.1 choline BCCT transporter BetT [Brevibacterium sandarakinum]